MSYRVKPIGKTCAGTGEPLVPGARIHSVLVDKGHELVRLDFSEAGWKGPPEGTVGHWMCIVPESARSGPKPIDTESLFRFFEETIDDQNPIQEKFRYVVAILLLQKRRLQLEGSRKDGEIDYLQLVGSRSEGPFEVRDQHLPPAEIKQLQNELHAHLAAFDEQELSEVKETIGND
jgi:hypothetical protein